MVSRAPSGALTALFLVGLTAVAQGQDVPSLARLPVYPCVLPDSTNPVYFETSSAEWSWSPDGASIVYDRAVGRFSQLRVLDLVSGEVRCFTRGDGYDTQPSWSAGDRLAFVRRVNGVPQVHVLDLIDRTVRPLTDDSVASQHPALSPDGRALAYVRATPNSQRRRLVVVRDLETDREDIVFESPFGLNNLSWTPHGTAVLFYSIDDDGWNDLYEVLADGSGVTRLTDNTVTDTYSAEYSPDGSRLAFGQGSEDSPYTRWFNYDLYERDVTSGSVRRLTWAYLPDDRVHYAPDGHTIGFTTRRTGYPEIHLMDGDGTNLRAVTAQPETELGQQIGSRGVAVARTYFNRLRREHPDARLIGARAAAVLTRQLIGRGETRQAAAVARIGVMTYPDSWWTLTALGEALLASGDDAAAMAAFTRSLAVSPNQPNVVFLLGLTRTLEVFDTIETVWRERAGDLADLAERLQRRGEFLGALTLLQRLENLHGSDPDLLYALGRTRMMLGDHDAAIATFRRVLDLDAGHRGAGFHLNRLQAR